MQVEEFYMVRQGLPDMLADDGMLYKRERCEAQLRPQCSAIERRE